MRQSEGSAASSGGFEFGRTARRFAASVARQRQLIGELVRREIKGGHAQHGLGALWFYAQPLIVVAAFMLVFGVVIGGRINVTASFPGDYTSYILVGLVPWLVTANVLARAPSIFISNANLVKQVVFPIEVLPVAAVLATLANYAPALALMLGYKLTVGGGLGVMALALPLVVAAHVLLLVGITLVLAIITPFVRDVREIVTAYTAVSMYFTPAVYLPDWVPPMLRPILYLNPFSYVVWAYQDVLFFDRVAHPGAWAVLAVMTAAALAAGLALFAKIKPYLGNVL